MLVTQPMLGKCPAIRIPIPRRSTRCSIGSDWRSGFLVINQYCAKQTSLQRSIERVDSINPDLRQSIIGLRSDAFLPENE